MSCLIVKKQIINIVTTYLYSVSTLSFVFLEIEKAGFSAIDSETIGKAMFDMNIHSVKSYYKENFDFHFKIPEYQYEFEFTQNKYRILKNLDFYLYQSCEGDCMETPLYKALNKIRTSLMGEIISELSEYQTIKL